MNLFAPIGSVAAAEGKAAIDKLRRRAVIIGATALLALTAFAFLLVALHVWLAGIYGPQAAPLFIALGAILLILVVLLAGNLWIHATEKSERAERRRREMAMAATAAITAAPLMLRNPLVRRLLIPAAAVGAVAFLGVRALAGGDED